MSQLVLYSLSARKSLIDLGAGLVMTMKSQRSLPRASGTIRMPSPEVDEIDFGILHLLQENARDTSTVAIAEELSVSDQTIRNRIGDLEESGILEGYYPKINYEKAGFRIRIRFTCTAPLQERTALADEALDVQNIVRVEETHGSRENVRPLAVTSTVEEITNITSDLEQLGLVIESQHLVANERVRPFNHFGEHVVTTR